jgi:cephalosporin hydroxylase
MDREADVMDRETDVADRGTAVVDREVEQELVCRPAWPGDQAAIGRRSEMPLKQPTADDPGSRLPPDRQWYKQKVTDANGKAPKRIAVKRWVTSLSPVEEAITSLFHRMYYRASHRTWEDTAWLGTPIVKCPLDLWVYQELLTRVRPDVIIETGTCKGGSAYYLASICDLLDNGRVVTVDISTEPDRPQHSRITYLTGSSTSAEILSRISEEASGTVMVVLDSDHKRAHVLDELAAYSPLVTPGSYLIVEDTNLNGHPVAGHVTGGPMEAAEEFLGSHPEFRIDRACEKFFMTFSPRGYLRRV